MKPWTLVKYAILAQRRGSLIGIGMACYKLTALVDDVDVLGRFQRCKCEGATVKVQLDISKRRG